MLDGDANPNILDHNGYITLENAILGNCLVSVDKLARARVNVNFTLRSGFTALSLAGLNGQIDKVKKLIKAGAYLNVGALTPLYLAANQGHVDCVKELIQAGADLSVDDPTPLHFAANKGHIDCVKELIQAGADLNNVDITAHTASMKATINLSFDSVSVLLKAGAELNTPYLRLMIESRQIAKGTVYNRNQWRI